MYTVASGCEEDLDVAALMGTHGELSCRPTCIISFNSECGSVNALASGSQHISSITGAAEDYNMPAGLATTTGVTEVVAMAEVSATALNFQQLI